MERKIEVAIAKKKKKKITKKKKKLPVKNYKKMKTGNSVGNYREDQMPKS